MFTCKSWMVAGGIMEDGGIAAIAVATAVAMTEASGAADGMAEIAAAMASVITV